jgi:hypothetical protein
MVAQNRLIATLCAHCLAGSYFKIRAVAGRHIWSELRITDRVTIVTGMVPVPVPVQKHSKSLQSLTWSSSSSSSSSLFSIYPFTGESQGMWKESIIQSLLIYSNHAKICINNKIYKKYIKYDAIY